MQYLVWPKLKQADTAAEYLAQMPELVDLSLPESDLTGAGLARFAPLAQLSRLARIDCSGLDDSGLAQLPELAGLTTLHLNGCPISGPGLKALERTPNLKVLGVDSTLVDSAGLEDIPPALPLRYLTLSNTNLDDAAIPHLSRLNGLRRLHLLEQFHLLCSGYCV